MVSTNDSNQRSWYRGQAAWKKLAKKDPGYGTTSLSLKMNGFGPAFELDLQELLGAPYVLRRIGTWESSESDWNDGRNKYSIQSGLKIVLEDLRSKTIVALEDVGVGIAQCIPVITAAREQSLPILFIEQPELHLHPRQQAMLADVFVNQLGRSSRWWEMRNGEQSEERTIVLETHSELVLLRLLRRIRESKTATTSDLSKATASASSRISSEDLRVYAVENIEGSTNFRCLPISKSGDIVGGWPEGFFDERMDEVL